MAENIEEAVGELVGVPDVEKVYLQEETKLYRTRAILAYLDSPFLDFSDTTIDVSSPVPVLDEEKRQVGFASVQLMGDRLVADIAIDYATPERLTAETREGVRQYVRIEGQLHVRIEADVFIDTYGSTTKVLSMAVEALVLSSRPPKDGRLLPFGERVLL